MTNVDTCTASEAVDRALRALNQGQYLLGCGDYLGEGRGMFTSREDLYPSGTRFFGETGGDCCAFAVSYTWKVKRHRPGFNASTPANHRTVVDYLNVDSVWEDAAYGAQEFGVALPTGEAPRPGDLAITRSIRRGQVKHAPTFSEMGHVRIFTKGPVAWDPSHPRYVSCEMAELHGPNGCRGPIRCSGQSLDSWNAKWPTPEFCVVVVRPHERV